MAKKSQKESFSIIPTRAIVSAELNNLSVSARWLYIVLTTGWRRDQEHKEFLLTYEQIRNITHFNYTKIRNCLLELERAGFIYIEHGRLCNKPNRYKMNVNWLHLRTIGRSPDGNI